MRLVRAAFAVALVAGAVTAPRTPASARLEPEAKRVLTAYVAAIAKAHYQDAFDLLIPSERAYFKNAVNFGSIFSADGLQITRFSIVGSRDAGTLGVVGLVSEHVSFLDHAHGTRGTATVTVPYGLVPSAKTYRVKDPFHPWKAFLTPDIQGTAGGLRVSVHKVSLFAGRVEILMTFANIGSAFVTLLPYGRSVLRDENGTVMHPIATRLSGLTDKQLYLGLRLAPVAQYTGTLNFETAARFAPHHLTLTLAPFLRDGADAPFEVDLPTIDVP
jgi:hypothetical protein